MSPVWIILERLGSRHRYMHLPRVWIYRVKGGYTMMIFADGTCPNVAVTHITARAGRLHALSVDGQLISKPGRTICAG